MAETPYLVDSNILLRWIKPDHSDYPAIVSAIKAFFSARVFSAIRPKTLRSSGIRARVPWIEMAMAFRL
jgi:hypothetical protein